MRTAAELRRERRGILDAVDSALTPGDIAAFQTGMASHILAAELELGVSKASNRRRDLRFHLTSLRLYADCLAWRLLSPLAIRRLAEKIEARPSLVDQRAVVDRVLADIQMIASFGSPAIMADLTNVLTVGDIVVVDDEDAPTLIECKSSLPEPRFWKRGRLGRQITDALDAAHFLSGGPRKKLPNSVRISANLEPLSWRNYAAVADCVTGALSGGLKWTRLSEHEYIWAASRDRWDGSLGEVFSRAGWPPGTLVGAGTSARTIEPPWGLFPPPAGWPLDADSRSALMEQDVIVAHALNLAVLHGSHRGVEIEVTQEPYPIAVRWQGWSMNFSERFINNVIYGFQTVAGFKETVASAAIASAENDGRADASGEDPSVSVLLSVRSGQQRASGGQVHVIDDTFWTLLHQGTGGATRDAEALDD